jgi:predicted nucleic acid-binding protein
MQHSQTVFVDTGAWFAAVVPTDPDHGRAQQWLRQNDRPLVTTDYVLDELLTLLLVRRERQRALQVGAALLNGSLADLYWMTDDDIHHAWQTFQHFSDKGWSFTDCTSRAVMERLRITTAFAFDDHFRQFGLGSVVPLDL